VLGKLGEAHVTQSLVRHEDMAGGLHNGIKRSQGSDFAAVAQDLVAIAAAGLATVPENSRRSFILNEIVFAFEHFKVIPHPELHRGSRLLTAHTTVAIDSQCRIASHLALKGAAHTSPVTSRHGLLLLMLLSSFFL
jgi:hypothetical protein